MELVRPDMVCQPAAVPARRLFDSRSGSAAHEPSRVCTLTERPGRVKERKRKPGNLQTAVTAAADGVGGVVWSGVILHVLTRAVGTVLQS